MIELYNALSEANPNACNAVLTVIEGADFGDKCLLSAGSIVWERDGKGFFANHRKELQAVRQSGELLLSGQRVFCEVLGGEKKLVICGAGHVAIPLIRLGVMLGFRVTVLEDREDFARHAEEAGAAQVICAPFTEGLARISGDEDTYFCVITRGHSYDRECMNAICRKPHAYIGMIGSKRHGEFVRAYLAEQGVSADVIGEIHSPVGLKIGSETPEEIAVSIAAEIIQVKSQTGRSSTYPRELMRAITGQEAAETSKALVTIVAREGSAPRDVGSKMLVYPDGHILGTIGGGSFEYAAMRRAGELLASGKSASVLFEESLKAGKEESGMVCGGSLSAIIEIIEPGHQV